MANQAHSNSYAALRALRSFLSVLLLVAVGVMVIAVMVGLPRMCGIQPAEFTAVPTDVNGRLEYCVAQSVPQYKAARKTVIHPGASCGPDKALLLARADSMTEQARMEVLACQAQSTPQKVEMLLEKILAFLS